jgi:hypothetical protein
MPKDIKQRVFPHFLGLAVTVIICWLLTILKFVSCPGPGPFPVLTALSDGVLAASPQGAGARGHPAGGDPVPRPIVYLVGTIVLQSMVSFTDGFPRYEDRWKP